MSLLSLPPELIDIVCRYLDAISISSLFCTRNKSLRFTLLTRDVINELRLSFSTDSPHPNQLNDKFIRSGDGHLIFSCSLSSIVLPSDLLEFLHHKRDLQSLVITNSTPYDLRIRRLFSYLSTSLTSLKFSGKQDWYHPAGLRKIGLNEIFPVLKDFRCTDPPNILIKELPSTLKTLNFEWKNRNHIDWSLSDLPSTITNLHLDSQLISLPSSLDLTHFPDLKIAYIKPNLFSSVSFTPSITELTINLPNGKVFDWPTNLTKLDLLVNTVPTSGLIEQLPKTLKHLTISNWMHLKEDFLRLLPPLETLVLMRNLPFNAQSITSHLPRSLTEFKSIEMIESKYLVDLPPNMTSLMLGMRYAGAAELRFSPPPRPLPSSIARLHLPTYTDFNINHVDILPISITSLEFSAAWTVTELITLLKKRRLLRRISLGNYPVIIQDWDHAEEAISQVISHTKNRIWRESGLVYFDLDSLSFDLESVAWPPNLKHLDLLSTKQSDYLWGDVSHFSVSNDPYNHRMLTESATINFNMTSSANSSLQRHPNFLVDRLADIFPLPDGLEYLRIATSNKSQLTNQLPDSLRHLSMDNIQVADFSHVPQSLLSLTLVSQAIDLSHVSNLPKTITKLELPSQTNFPDIVLDRLCNLKYLDIPSCDWYFGEGYSIPNLEFLRIRSLKNDLIKYLPKTLTRLICPACHISSMMLDEFPPLKEMLIGSIKLQLESQYWLDPSERTEIGFSSLKKACQVRARQTLNAEHPEGSSPISALRWNLEPINPSNISNIPPETTRFVFGEVTIHNLESLPSNIHHVEFELWRAIPDVPIFLLPSTVTSLKVFSIFQVSDLSRVLESLTPSIHRLSFSLNPINPLSLPNDYHTHLQPKFDLIPPSLRELSIKTETWDVEMVGKLPSTITKLKIGRIEFDPTSDDITTLQHQVSQYQAQFMERFGGGFRVVSGFSPKESK